MTQRLYYDDSLTQQFSARIVEHTEYRGWPALVLDRTYFYPTGGGQPHDTGLIAGIPVIEVATRKGDSAVLHVMQGTIEGSEVSCEINWARRLHHMQHHTGQHILTQAFVQLCNADTVGFHLGDGSITIDVNSKNLSDLDIKRVEELVNQIITEDRPVIASLIDPANIEGIRMRKMPDEIYTDGLRVVEVADFDRTACGGTHVPRTGMIGLLKVIKMERRGDGTRIEFLCGGRAFEDYRQKHNIVSFLAADFTCAVQDVPDTVSKLRSEFQELQRAYRQARTELFAFEAQRTLADITVQGGIRIVKAIFTDRDPEDLKALAILFAQQDDVIALLGTAGQKTHVIIARGKGVEQDVRPLLQEAFKHIEGSKGGGRTDFAQGGGTAHTEEALTKALRAANRLFYEVNICV